MQEFAAAVIVTLCMFSGLVLRYMPFRSLVTPKRKKVLFAIYTAVCLLNVGIATVILRVFGLGATVQYLFTGASIFALVMTGINILMIPGRFGEHVFALGIVRTIHFLLLSVPVYAVSLSPELDTGESMMLFLLLYGGILLVTHWFLQRLLRKTIEPFLKLVTGNYWKTIFFIPMAFFIASAIFVWGAQSIDPLLQMISSFTSGTMLVLMCWSIGADHQRIQERQLMEQQLEGQKLHYAQMKIRVEDTRKLNHNLKHHIAAIRGYADRNDMEGLGNYCDELMARIGDSSQVPYTGNVAVDGVLYHHLQLARQDAIDIRLVGIIRSPGIADIDLCALLGNALDNAVAGCRTVEGKRKISIISQSEKQLLSIVVSNTFDGRVKQGKDGLLSTKQETGHSVGMSSMRSICQRYGGSFAAEWDENTFTVILMLPLRES